MGTLGFALIAQLVANNWLAVTRGPLCISAIAPLRLPYPGGTLQVITLQQSYYVILAIAALSILSVGLISRSRLGIAFRAVRDDPVLAAARGLSPNQLRLAAFTVSAALSALVGVFAAHFETVVCPSYIDLSITVLLLIMVFVGGRGSLRGVVTAAIVFTVVPELLRIAQSWRLVIFGVILLITVTVFPDGFENIYASTGRLISRLLSRPAIRPSEPAVKV
jgi:ABC-type branched-subunit amino acid transport system permease subunit